MVATAHDAVRVDLVPLRTRLRYLQGFRIAAMAVFVVAALAGAGEGLAGNTLLPLALGYAAVTTLVVLLWLRTGERRVWLFGLLLTFDGIVLVWGVMAARGLDGWLSPLLVLHLVVVSLLASYRTGMRVALWHTLVLVTAVEAGRIGLVADFQVPDRAELWSIIGLMWLVALLASATAAVNERELRRSRHDLQGLAALAEQLERTTDSRVVAQQTVEAITRTFDVEEAVLLDTRENHVSVLASSLPVEGLETVDIAEIQAVERVVRVRDPVLAARLDPDDDAPLEAALEAAHHLVLLPLVAEGDVLAVLVIVMGSRSGSRLESRVLSSMQRFAAHAALALNSAWLHDSLQERATTDGLTGLANRRTFDSALIEELARTNRTGEPTAVALLDLDHFKRLNDEFGHQTGDEVLRQVAAALTNLARPYDVAARYGGEEFGLVLSGTDEDGAVAVGQRMRRAIAAAPAPAPVTASVGVAATEGSGVHPDDLVAAADEALYRAKRDGRNRVVSANDLKDERLGPTGEPVGSNDTAVTTPP